MKFLPSTTITALAIVLTIVRAKKLPDYVKKCKSTDPKINDCITDAANKLFPRILEGNKELNVPNLSPLTIASFEGTSDNLTYKFDNVTIKGFDTLSLEEVAADLAKSLASKVLHCKHLRIDGLYDLKGVIGDRPVDGRGPFHVEHDGIAIKLHMKWTQETRNGEIHSKWQEFWLTDWRADKSRYEFVDDEETGKFFSEHVDLARRHVSGPIVDEFVKIVKSVLEHLTVEYAVKEFFADDER